jgi:hypothetical protein
MDAIMHLGIASATILLFNLPFGYWRAHAGKFSLQWFLAVHLPVLLAISLRVLGGLGWHLLTFPALVGAYFMGQLLGGRIHGQWQKRAKMQLSACLVCDLWKKLHSNGTRTL